MWLRVYMEEPCEANLGRQKGTVEIVVSIIIPVYKASEYIERCLKSVMNQTYGSIECIMVDDASPDDSMDKCEELISKYAGSIRLKILHHEKNRGLSAARNTGTDAATGNYIFYLDSDDELPEDAIEKLVKPVLRDATVEMVMGNHQRISDGDVNPALLQPMKMQREQDLASSDDVRHYFYCERGFYGNAWNRLIKREFITQNKLVFKEGLLWEDHLWSFFVMKHLRHLYIILLLSDKN